MADKTTREVIGILTNMAKRKNLQVEDLDDIQKIANLVPKLIDQHNPELVKLRSIINYSSKLASDIAEDEKDEAFSNWKAFDRSYMMKFNYLSNLMYEVVDQSIVNDFSSRLNNIFSLPFSKDSLAEIFNTLYTLGDILGDVHGIKSVANDRGDKSRRKRSR
jgi:hypothetical protein